MIAAAASQNCVALTYMSRLTDFGVWHCFYDKLFSFEELLIDQRIHTWSDSIYLQMQQLQCIHAASPVLDLYSGSSDHASLSSDNSCLNKSDNICDVN